MDPRVAERLRAAGVPTLYGDAANSEILQHAGLDRARALIVTVPDETAAEIIVASVRRVSPGLHMLAVSVRRITS
jgi:CPA2 family monovalent cation:H+ antiporter-2